MAITVQPITPSFAAEVGDIDLGRPISAPDIAAIKQAFTKYAVLVFPDQTFGDESHLDFAGRRSAGVQEAGRHRVEMQGDRERMALERR